jgi:SAM-dependent methyltransferase
VTVIPRSYVGGELPLFLEARNFHRYYLDLFKPWLRGRVLEVGGGLGALTESLLELGVDAVTVCEPDTVLAASLAERVGPRADVVVGGLREVPPGRGVFDAILYVDVLEHIEDDRAELVSAARRLSPGGALLVGGPAHDWLFSPFDAAIGHHRRYDRARLRALIAGCPTLDLVCFAYFDCLGILLSLGNRWLAGQRMPSPRQMRFWDRLVLPMSRRLDGLFAHRVGKSFVAVARRR